MRTLAAAIMLSVALASCSDASPTAEGPPEINAGTVLIETDGSSDLLYVRIAETAAQRTEAFETTAALDDDEGLAFLYFEPTTDPFVMEGDIELSIAFFDLDGRIVEILDVEPCGGDEPAGCPAYDPGVAYSGALGVDRGGFDRLGVDEGAVIEIVPGSE